jgi:hypothetical protein
MPKSTAADWYEAEAPTVNVLHVRLPRDLAQRVREAAKADHRSLNSMFAVLLERGLGDIVTHGVITCAKCGEPSPCPDHR